VRVRVPVRAFTVVLLFSSLLSASPVQDYAGRYSQAESVVAFTAVNDQLYVRPVEWSGRQPLVLVGPDRFQMEERAQRTFVFTRDRQGRPERVEIAGMDTNGVFQRLGPGKRPLELLAEGEGERAWRAFRARGVPMGEAGDRARVLFERRASVAPAYLELMEAAHRDAPRDATILAGLGRARIATADRAGGHSALEASLRRAPWLSDAQEALRMLDHTGDAALPIPLDAIYAPPTAEELQRVAAQWASRDLAPRDVKVEDRFTLDREDARFDVEIVSHLVHGSRHHGAILTPAGADAKSRPVLLEVKGVSWNFSPLALPGGSTALRILGTDAARFVLVIPGLRGETLVANGKEYRSEGDPAESWDGAADDAIAFLNVALERAAAADAARIAVFGRSRGGTVSLLVGERDPRIDRVLAWSAPAGWIEDMPSRGFTQREIAGEGLRRHSLPNMIGGQTVRTFLRGALAGRESLEEARDRLIASSPVYFAARLPRTAAYWGIDDPIVESANGRRLRDAAAAAGASDRVTVAFHAEGGHDLDPARARPDSREFLLALLR
jgi:hypothetical protein